MWRVPMSTIDVMQELESLRAEVEKIRDRTDEPPESR